VRTQFGVQQEAAGIGRVYDLLRQR
jgi:hypothetical protein